MWEKARAAWFRREREEEVVMSWLVKKESWIVLVLIIEAQICSSSVTVRHCLIVSSIDCGFRVLGG